MKKDEKQKSLMKKGVSGLQKRERRKERNKRKLVFYSFSAVLLLLVFFTFRSDSRLTKKEYYFYYPARYDVDIFQNNHYEELERGVRFGSGGVTQLYRYQNEEDYNEAPEAAKFFLDYFDTVIRGKYEELPKFYVAGFQLPEKFTMQMLYDAEVVLNSFEDAVIDGVETRVYNYNVIYKIFQNNGTFRLNIHSNSAVPQIYQVIQDPEEGLKIYKILEIVNE